MKPPVTVRRAGAGDEPVLLGPWLSYCRFSGVEFPPSVSDSVIRRICDPENRMNALLAMDDLGVALGFVNYLMHDFTFGDSYACLAEDLFVRPVARGLGVGTLLMSSLLALARSEGCARIYWVTHESNHAARRMFDEHFARPDGNIRVQHRSHVCSSCPRGNTENQGHPTSRNGPAEGCCPRAIGGSLAQRRRLDGTWSFANLTNQRKLCE